jgi:hypothetical protein
MKTTKKTKLINSLVTKFGSKVFKRKDILELIFEHRNMKYNPNLHSGTWSTHLQPSSRSMWGYYRCGYMMKSTKSDQRYLERVGHGLYKIILTRVDKLEMV